MTRNAPPRPTGLGASGLCSSGHPEEGQPELRLGRYPAPALGSASPGHDTTRGVFPSSRELLLRTHFKPVPERTPIPMEASLLGVGGGTPSIPQCSVHARWPTPCSHLVPCLRASRPPWTCPRVAMSIALSLLRPWKAELLVLGRTMQSRGHDSLCTPAGHDRGAHLRVPRRAPSSSDQGPAPQGGAGLPPCLLCQLSPGSRPRRWTLAAPPTKITPGGRFRRA